MSDFAPLRVFGIDPGLTRCGLAVVDVWQNRKAALVAVDVVGTASVMDLAQRLLFVGEAVENYFQLYSPNVVAVERVFSQHNLRTVMGTAQVSGVVMFAAAKRNLPVALHTPTEVKAAVTGNGKADKAAVIKMVSRILKLDSVLKTADAADALALALCHAWREGLEKQLLDSLGSKLRSPQMLASVRQQSATSAQQIWLEALKKSKKK